MHTEMCRDGSRPCNDAGVTGRGVLLLATLGGLVGRTRRNPLYGRQPKVVLVLAAAGGVMAALLGLQPTGQVVVDTVLVFVAAAAVVWASATAPWWLVAVACVAAAAAVSETWLMIVGLAAAAMASLVGAERRNLPWARCVATMAAVYVFAQVEHRVFQGFSALLACTVLGGVGAALAAAVAGLTVSAVSARAPIEQGNRLARAGLDQVNVGDLAGASESFAAAARSFAQAERDLGSVLAQPARRGVDASSARAMRCRATVVLGTLPWNQLRTSSSSPMPCM